MNYDENGFSENNVVNYRTNLKCEGATPMHMMNTRRKRKLS